MFGGTPTGVFDLIAESEVIEMYTAMFAHRHTVVYQQTYEKLVLSLLVMCQDHKGTPPRLDLVNPWELGGESVHSIAPAYQKRS